MSALATEFVTYRQWDSLAQRIEKHNLVVAHRSLTASSISSRATGFIVEIQDDRKGMIAKSGWREAMEAERVKA